MKHRNIPLVAIFFLILFALLGLFFSLQKKDFKENNTNLIIVCTTNIIADTVKQIADKTCIIHTLMGPGVDPHLYRARESDIRKLASADIIFYNGLHLEGKMAEILKGMNRYTKSVAVSETLSKKQLRFTNKNQTACDPHIWLDVHLWITCTKHIARTIIDCDPEHANLYEQRLYAYVHELEQLDVFVKQLIMTIPEKQRFLVTAHDAFGYFGKAYNLHVVGLQGISTESETGTRDVQILAQFIAKQSIPAIFTESSIPEKNIHAVQSAVHSYGWNVMCGPELFADSLSDATSPASTYCSMIRYNAQTITQALKRLDPSF
jgi:manganese/zinc/iron transport system substrate-binding protein